MFGRRVMSSPRSTSRSKAKNARFAPRWSLSVDCSSWKFGRPLSSSATASPSIRQPGGRFHQRAERVAPVLGVAGPGGGRAGAGRDQQPVAVVIILEEPIVARRDLVDQSGELRLAEWGRRLARLLLRSAALLPAAV